MEVIMEVGFRFHPYDHEIIYHYLINKINGQNFNHVVELELCRFDPWELPCLSIFDTFGESVIVDNEEWYFFYRPEYKYKNSKRANRTTKTGFWKPTGTVRSIKGKGTDVEIATKRTLVFYYKESAAGKPVRTTWVIHEYQLKTQGEVVFCKLMYKSDDQTGNNLAMDEGEQNHGVVFGAETHVSPATIDDMDEEPIPEGMQASSEDEVDPLSWIVEPEEYVSEARSTLPNDYRPQRPLSAVYYQNGSDMESQVVHAESLQDVATSRIYPGERNSTELRQIGRVQTLIETLPPLNRYMDECRTTGFDDKLQINVLTLGRAEMPEEPRKTELLQVQPRPPGYMAQKEVKQGFSRESQESRITAKVTGANQDLKINRTGPPSLCVFNIFVALVVSIAIVRCFFTG